MAALRRNQWPFCPGIRILTKPIDFKDLEITIDKTLKRVSHLREQQQKLQKALDELHNLVFYDQLTGLPNRNNILREITKSIKAKQTQSTDFALLMLDIERHSLIKYCFGHALSDPFIEEVARRLEQNADPDTVTARIGESVFAILWHSLDSLDVIPDRAARLSRLLEPPFQLKDISVRSKIRTGIALSDLPYAQPETFYQAADIALQIAKQDKNDGLVTFDLQMQEKGVQRLNLEVDLHKAIEADQLSLHYQPIFQLDTKKIVSFEVLVRWHHPEKGLVMPDTFIPLAEETGLIIPLGEWVLSTACRKFGEWKARFGDANPARISVNVSSLQLLSANLIPCIDDSLKSSGLSGSDLTLEITESVLMENIEEEIEVLDQLRKRDIKLSIDDFGTGYSSLSYLQKLPIDALKIDRSFIQDIEMNPTNFDIAAAIITLARQLNLEVIAEGLEKERHLDILRSLSCQYGQGYIFSKPLDVNAATALIPNQDS